MLLAIIVALLGAGMLGGVTGYLFCNHVMSNRVFEAAQDINDWLELRQLILEHDVRIRLEAERRSAR